jgi:hypothetical protein
MREATDVKGSNVDIGEEIETIVVEPLESPVPVVEPDVEPVGLGMG